MIDVTSVVYELPFGKGRKFATGLNPVAEALFGGWEINAIDTAHTGSAINVNYGPAAANDVTGAIADYRGLAVLRPNVSGSSHRSEQGRHGEHTTLPDTHSPRLRPAIRSVIWAAMPSARPASGSSIPGINKSFRIHEGVRVQFRSEFFNILNKTNFSPPNGYHHQRRVRDHPQHVMRRGRSSLP